MIQFPNQNMEQKHPRKFGCCFLTFPSQNQSKHRLKRCTDLWRPEQGSGSVSEYLLGGESSQPPGPREAEGVNRDRARVTQNKTEGNKA